LDASNFRRDKETFAVARTSSGAGETAPGADSISEAYIEVANAHFMGTPAGTERRLYAVLATGVGLDTKILTDKLPTFSQAVKRDPDASSYERACAAYLGKDYAEAERLFLAIAGEANKPFLRKPSILSEP
jgi:TolA-binding protein